MGSNVQVEGGGADDDFSAKAQITARLAKQDLLKLKAKALELGMPCQTLLVSVVHRYVTGRLVDKG